MEESPGREPPRLCHQPEESGLAVSGPRRLSAGRTALPPGWRWRSARKVLGENHPDYGDSLNDLAALYHAQGDYARAEPLFRQASEIWKKVLGENNPDYATSLNNLAELYRAQGDYARAEPLCRRALEIRKKVLGENHPDYGSSLNALAHLYHDQGDYPRAEPLCAQGIGDRQRKSWARTTPIMPIA